MELTVLGRYGPYPKAGSAASGYLLKDENDYLIMDMGSGVLSRLVEAVDVRKVKHVYISHLHFDHTSDLLAFRYLLEDLKHTVNVYTHYEDSDWYKILFDSPNFNIINIDESTHINIGKMSLSFLQMEHTAVDYAVIIKSENKALCYTGDTIYNDNIPICFEQSDWMLMDCSKPEGFDGPHMTVVHAKELSKKYSAKIIATHLSPDYDPTDDFSDYPEITVAKELETYKL